jgi:hypothetical protein
MFKMRFFIFFFHITFNDKWISLSQKNNFQTLMDIIIIYLTRTYMMQQALMTTYVTMMMTI